MSPFTFAPVLLWDVTVPSPFLPQSTNPQCPKSIAPCPAVPLSHHAPGIVYQPIVPQSHFVSGPVIPGPIVYQSHCVPVPLCPSPSVYHPLCEPGPVCPNPIVSQSHSVPVPLCTSPFVNQSQCVPVPLCPSPSVPVPLCPSPIAYQPLCVPVPLCTSPSVSQSQCVLLLVPGLGLGFMVWDGQWDRGIGGPDAEGPGHTGMSHPVPCSALYSDECFCMPLAGLCSFLVVCC